MPTNVVSVYLRFLHLTHQNKVPNLLPFPNLSALAQQPLTAAGPARAPAARSPGVQPRTAAAGPARAPPARATFGPTPPSSALLELRSPAPPDVRPRTTAAGAARAPPARATFGPTPPPSALLELRSPARPAFGPGPPQQALLELWPTGRPVCVGPALASSWKESKALSCPSPCSWKREQGTATRQSNLHSSRALPDSCPCSHSSSLCQPPITVAGPTCVCTWNMCCSLQGTCVAACRDHVL
jgi:hypothetical protein